MKTKVKKERMIKVSESVLLSLVADKLKDRVLFPEKAEMAKEYLSKVRVTPLQEV
jgi:hypothetical protein